MVDTDGRVVPIGETGEICARGYMTMLGYWRDEEKTAEVLKDSGWFHTGYIPFLLIFLFSIYATSPFSVTYL